MLERLQRFVKEELAYITQQDDIQFIYDTGGELVGEIHTEQGFVTHIDFYDADQLANAGIPFSNSAALNAVLRPNDVTEEVDAAAIVRIAREMKEALDDRALQLDCLVDFDCNYLAVFEEVEHRYGLPVPNSGLQLAIKRDGTLSSATFIRQPFTVIYPEHMISKEEARHILQEVPLVQLAFREEGWQYVYVPTFDVYGIEADGQLMHLGGKRTYEPLPEVKEIPGSLQDFLLGGRAGQATMDDTEEGFYWECTAEEVPASPVLSFSAFEHACRALQAIVGHLYAGYELEQRELPAEPSMEMEEAAGEWITYHFVYCYEGVYLSDYAAEMTIHRLTGHIRYITVPKIPVDQLAASKPPVITLESANHMAQQLVDVTLSMERVDIADNLYTAVYMVEYPSSPTKGEIKSIDAYSGEIRFVETGLMDIEE